MTLLCTLWSQPAHAQACTVQSGGLRFGAFDSLSGAPLDSTGSITVTCAPGLPYRVVLGSGLHSSNRFHPRRMQRDVGAAELYYNLFVDASRSRVWGDGTRSTVVPAGVGTGRPELLTVFGRIEGGQIIPAGHYSDVVRITVEW